MDDRLWVCHTCEMIGSKEEATLHATATRHDIEELSDEMTEALREEWAKGEAEFAIDHLVRGT
jgi:hypothetical protein